MSRDRFFAFSVIAGIVLVLLACVGFLLPAHLLFTLAVGWMLYLWRTVPQVAVAWSGVATAFVALAGATVGTHLFARWWVRNTTPDPAEIGADVTPPEWPIRRTAAVVSLVVLTFVAGLATTGAAHQLVWLVTSPEPLIGGTARTAARRTQSKNNLKQLGLALHNYQDVYSVFPMGGTFDDLGRPHHGWMTIIMPFIEANPLYGNIDRNRPWDHPANAGLFHFDMPVYLIPGVEPERIGDDPLALGAAHYSANAHLFGANVGTRLSDIADGPANTLLVGEAARNFKAWGDPTNVRDPVLGINTSSDGFGGPWEGGAQFVFADGAVRFLSDGIDPAVLKAIATPAGGETLPADW